MTDRHCSENENKTQDILWAEFKKNLPAGRPLIGIDYGAVRIGVAVSDKERNLAYPLKIISKIVELDDIVRSREACGFVIGMPYQPDGTEGDTAHSVRLFAKRLEEKFGLPIFFIDERHSSTRAESFMMDIGMRRNKIKKTLDANVARDLLQKVLDRR